jgi:D-3-phosphoglycerate dehydrogenase
MSPPVVLADAPLWSGRWDYSVERRLIAEAGAELIVPGGPTENERLLGVADIVLRGSRRLDAPLIARLGRCVGLVTYSVGLDGIDLDAAASAGIAVRNVPDYCTAEVADHATLLVLAAVRRLPHWIDTTSRGRWLRPEDQATLRRMAALTVGIIGAGRIGRGVARRLRAFDAATIAFDPHLTGPLEGLPLVTKEELLARADIIVVCASSNAGAAPVIDEAAIAALGRPRPVIVNVARGALVDERALATALHSGRVGAAALDVRSEEPPDPATDPLAGAPNLLLTPHVGAASASALEDLRAGVGIAAVELLRDAGRVS